MATDVWINETLYPDWGQRFLVKRELARVQSAFQDIVIFDSTSHGRVMVLDGVIQITEADEFVYQEMLTHVPLLAHGAAGGRADHRRRRRRRAAPRAAAPRRAARGDGGDRRRGDPAGEGIPARRSPARRGTIRAPR